MGRSSSAASSTLAARTLTPRMRNVFEFRDQLIAEYASFSRSFTRFRAEDISRAVESEYKKGRFWPEPLIQVNPNYQRAKNVDELVAEGVLHPVCAQLFRFGPNQATGVEGGDEHGRPDIVQRSDAGGRPYLELTAGRVSQIAQSRAAIQRERLRRERRRQRASDTARSH